MSDNLHFNRDLEEGEEYQDFIMLEFWKRGRPLSCYSSKKFQLQNGESLQQIEIKYDRLNCKTGNVFIETEAESKDKTHFVKGGIYKEDKAIYYLIGDYNKAWLFKKKALVYLWENQKMKNDYINNGLIIPKEQSYSKGFLLTKKFLDNSELFVLERFDFV